MIYYLILIIIAFFIEFKLYLKDNYKLSIVLSRYVFINSILLIILLKIQNDVFLVLSVIAIKLFIDRFFAFKDFSYKITNWEKYYCKKNLKIIEKKRKVNIDYITTILKNNNFKGNKIIEYGGGNSKVAEELSKIYKISKFSIVDSNSYGIKLLDGRNIANLDKNCISIFDFETSDKYDLSYSIGLIEHFKNKELVDCVNSHFNYLNSKGLVLITFPVPTIKYRIIRFILEFFDLWNYPDEIPPKVKDIEKIVAQKGQIIHSSINKKLILPQATILVRRK